MASRTVETVLVLKGSLIKLFFIYNYEGYSYRVFENHLNLIRFFQNKMECCAHFNTDKEVYWFMLRVKLSN